MRPTSNPHSLRGLLAFAVADSRCDSHEWPGASSHPLVLWWHNLYSWSDIEANCRKMRCPLASPRSAWCFLAEDTMADAASLREGSVLLHTDASAHSACKHRLDSAKAGFKQQPRCLQNQGVRNRKMMVSVGGSFQCCCDARSVLTAAYQSILGKVHAHLPTPGYP